MIHSEMLHGMGKLRRVQMLRAHRQTPSASNTGGLLFFVCLALVNASIGQKGQRPAGLGQWRRKVGNRKSHHRATHDDFSGHFG